MAERGGSANSGYRKTIKQAYKQYRKRRKTYIKKAYKLIIKCLTEVYLVIYKGN